MLSSLEFVGGYVTEEQDHQQNLNHPAGSKLSTLSHFSLLW
jgi:hypothetical protein